MSGRMMKRLPRGLLFLSLVIALFPLLVTILESLASESEVTRAMERGELLLIPARVTGTNYFQLLFASEWYLRVFWNSLFLTGAMMAGQMLTSIALGYLLSFIRFRSRNLLGLLMLLAAVLPYQVSMLPNYLAARRLGLVDSWWALLLPSWFSPLGALLLAWFMEGLPEGIVDAARQESDSPLIILARIVLPNVLAGVVAVGLMAFVEGWSMIEQPMVMLQRKSAYPLSLALESIRENAPGIFRAGAVLYAAPVVILYSLCKDALLEEMGEDIHGKETR